MDSIAIGTALKQLLGIDELETELQHLRQEVSELKVHPAESLPAWVTLRQAAEYAGTSYSSLRRSQNRSRRPNGGEYDAVIAGVGKWRKGTVIQWCEELGR